jgi:hypothetical protein
MMRDSMWEHARKRMPAKPLGELELPPLRSDLFDALRTILAIHGGSLELLVSGRCLFRFPQGTMMQRLFPMVENDRYEIQFPDGYLLLSSIGRNGTPYLWFDPRDLPAEVQKQLKQRGRTHAGV